MHHQVKHLINGQKINVKHIMNVWNYLKEYEFIFLIRVKRQFIDKLKKVCHIV